MQDIAAVVLGKILKGLGTNKLLKGSFAVRNQSAILLNCRWETRDQHKN
jgi:hypothetical protein